MCAHICNDERTLVDFRLEVVPWQYRSLVGDKSSFQKRKMEQLFVGPLQMDSKEEKLERGPRDGRSWLRKENSKQAQ